MANIAELMKGFGLDSIKEHIIKIKKMKKDISELRQLKDEIAEIKASLNFTEDYVTGLINKLTEHLKKLKFLKKK